MATKKKVAIGKEWDFNFITGGSDVGGGFGQQITRNSQATGSWDDPDPIRSSAIAPIARIQPPIVPQQTFLDKLKSFDIKGMASGIKPLTILSDLGKGLSHGLSQTGTAKMDRYMADAFANKPGLLQPRFQTQQAEQQKQDEFLRANHVNSIAGTIGEQIPQIPLWMAGQLGVSAVGKGLGKLSPSLIPLAEKAGAKLPGFIKGGLMDAATYGGVVAPVDSIRNNDNFSQFLDREKQLPGVFLGGAGIRGAGNIISKGVSGVKGAFSPRGVPLPPIEPMPLRIPITRPPVEPIRTSFADPIPSARIEIPQSRFQIKPDRATQGTPIPERPPLLQTSSMVNEHITPPIVGERITQPSTMPNESPLLRERQFAQNVRDSKIAPEVVKQNTLDNPLNYEPITNKGTFDKAVSIVETDSVKAREQFNAPSKGISADDVALGEALISRAIKDGDHVGANALIADLAEKLTTAGQAVQAAKIFKRLSPEGMLLYARRVVNTTNKDLLESLGKKAPKVELTPEDSLFITETMQRVQGLSVERDAVNASGLNPDTLRTLVDDLAQRVQLISESKPKVTGQLNEITGMIEQSNGQVTPTIAGKIDKLQQSLSSLSNREKDVAMAQVMKLISEKVPATFPDKLKALQRISLLLNPKTMIRNTLGNTVFGAIDNISNVVATPIDILTSKLLKTNRTTTLPSIRGQLKSAKEGLAITLKDAKLGIDTYGNKTQYEFSGKKNFDNPILHKLDKATITGLKLGDTPFHKAAFDDSIRQQMKLAKVEKPTMAMEEQAQRTADQRTYQDVNALTNAFKLAQSALNGGKEIGLGNLVLPFVKTPANILARALDYSVVGLQKALRESTKIGKGTFDQKAFVDSISRNVTGTALIMVGYDLAKKGIITGSANKDADVAAFERGLGKNDYAYKVGDNYYTYSWAQPGSLAIAIGSDIFIKGKDRKQAENVVTDAVKSGAETLFNQSLLKGLTSFMGGYSVVDSISKTVLNAPTQFIPTIAKQISQIGDPAQRTTISGTPLNTASNLIKARIPGLTKTLEPKVNTSGEEVQNFQGKNSLFNIFVNPGSSTTFKPNAIQRGILKLYDETGDNSIFPKVVPKSFTENGETIRLTPKEITTFQKTMGKSTESRMKPTIEDSSIGNSTKVKELKTAISKSYDEAKAELLSNRKL